MGQPSFFRQEASRANQNHLYGSPYAMTAFPYQTLTRTLCILLPLLVIFLLFIPYAEQYTVRGYIDSNQGISSIYPIKNGIVHQYSVRSGQHVKQGDILLSVNTYDDHLSVQEQQHILEQLQRRKKHLLNSLDTQKRHIQALKPLLVKKYIAYSLYQQEVNAVLTLEHSITEITQDISRYKHAQRYVIRAPISGLVTNITPQIGQRVQVSESILDIVPDNTTLIAYLTIPVSKIGYIRTNDLVTLHYDTYSNHQAQQTTGRITNISQTIAKESYSHSSKDQSEPYYRATVNLKHQTVFVNNIEHPLQLGMTCSVVVQGARKKIWQWMIDPLRRPQRHYA